MCHPLKTHMKKHCLPGVEGPPVTNIQLSISCFHSSPSLFTALRASFYLLTGALGPSFIAYPPPLPLENPYDSGLLLLT